MIIRGFIMLLLIDGYLSNGEGIITSNVNNCTISSENITLFNSEDFQYEVRVTFIKGIKELSHGIISGTNILCGDGNINCPVVVKATLANCSDDASSTVRCLFKLNRTIIFNETKINLQIKVIIQNISNTQKNETLNFTITAEFVKSLFSRPNSGEVKLNYCRPEAAENTRVSTSANYAYSNGSFCMIDNITLFKGNDVPYRVIVEFDNTSKTGNNGNITSTKILCDNDTSHCPLVVTAIVANHNNGATTAFDCQFNSNHTIEFNGTKIDLQIKVVIQNISNTQENETLNFTVSTEFLKSLFFKSIPGRATLTNCSLETTSATPVPTTIPNATYSNGSSCLIDSLNITAFSGTGVQYQIIVDIDKSNRTEKVGVIDSRKISCYNDSSFCLEVAKTKLANCDSNKVQTFDCLLNSNRTIKFNGTQIDLQIKVNIRNIRGTQEDETFNFTVSIKFEKELFLSELIGRKVILTNCSRKENSITTKSTPKPYTLVSTSAKAAKITPGKKQKSKSSNGKIALVVLAFFILLGVAIIACYCKYRKNLSNRPAYYNDISLNDPLHTEIKFFKADGEDVEDNDEEDNDDVLPLI